MAERQRTSYQVRTYSGMNMEDFTTYTFEEFDSKKKAMLYAIQEAAENPEDEIVIIEVQEKEIWNSLG